MKRSEMEKLLLNGLCDLGQWYHMPPERVAQALCVPLQPKDGWDPEEEPLPGKLSFYNGSLVEHADGFGWTVAYAANQGGRTERNKKILKAALEAYNAIVPLRRRLERAIAHIKGGKSLVVEVLAILEGKA